MTLYTICALCGAEHPIGDDCKKCTALSFCTQMQVVNVPAYEIISDPLLEIEPPLGTYAHAMHMQSRANTAKEKQKKLRSLIRIVSTEKQTPP